MVFARMGMLAAADKNSLPLDVLQLMGMGLSHLKPKLL